MPTLGLRVGDMAGHSWYGVMMWGVWAAGRTGEWGLACSGLRTRLGAQDGLPFGTRGLGSGRGGASRGPTPSHLSFLPSVQKR